MRIGIDGRPIETDKPTGIGVYLANVLSYISNNDHENEYFLFTNTKPLSNLKLGNNFHNIIVPAKVGTTAVRYKLPKYIKKLNLDVFWGTEHMLPKRVKGVRYVLTVHDIALMINKSWGSTKNVLMQNIFGKPSIKQADQITTISNSTKKDLINYLKIDPNKITTIYIGANKAPENPPKSIDLKIDNFDFKDNPKYFFYLGTIEPRKNIENLIKAFDKFVEDGYPNHHLILAGGLGWKYGGILKAYDNSKHKDLIHFVGYLNTDQKNFIYDHCLAYAFPTNYEGFGIPVLEAMSHGKPVISSNNSSIPEVGENLVFYCNPKDINSIAEQMKIVDKLTKEELENLSMKEKEHFKKFSWEKCADATLKFLTQKS